MAVAAKVVVVAMVDFTESPPFKIDGALSLAPRVNRCNNSCGFGRRHVERGGLSKNLHGAPLSTAEVYGKRSQSPKVETGCSCERRGN